MKKLSFLFPVCCLVLIGACGGDNSDTMYVDGSYKQEMREFVQSISRYAKGIDNDFMIIPQNGPELITLDGNEDGSPDTSYLGAIDGAGREDLFYGYDNDNEVTPEVESEYMMAFLDVCVRHGVVVLSTDYCWDKAKMDDSYQKNEAKSYISFAAPDRELNIIPSYPESPYNENNRDIKSLQDASNFLYLINPENFTSKQDFIAGIVETNYDMVIMDLFFDDEAFTAQEINQMSKKSNGGGRLVIAYMSIGEAEDYRYYWNNSWTVGSPSFIEAENPDWEGNYKVKYWEGEWQEIIFGTPGSYLDKIMSAGFDGVYLDIIDAFEYFE